MRAGSAIAGASACARSRAATTVLNAFVSHIPEPEAQISTDTHGPLSGVQLSIKASICAKGLPATAGSRMLASYVAPYSAVAVERATAAGASIVGVTNMDEFGMGSATSYSAHGPSFNPYSADWAVRFVLDERARRGEAPPQTLTAAQAKEAAAAVPVPEGTTLPRGWLTPGGSSGGGAVSVAVGSSTASLGSDTGGSVRQPAAYCGIVGFKPSYGRIPRHGLIAYASSLDTIGIMTRKVADAALLYAAVAGHDARDDSCVRSVSGSGSGSGSGSSSSATRAQQQQLLTPPLTWSPSHSRPPPPASPSKPLQGLRVGIPREYYVSELTSPVRGAWTRGADLLAQAGAEVVQVSLSHTAAALHAYYVIAPAEASSNLARYDGVRYGHRASASASPSPSSSASAPSGGQGSESSAHANNAAAALHDLYIKTRSEGFGPEVQRRILSGTYASSQSARSEFFDRALSVQALVRRDFASVFRPAPEAAMRDVQVSPMAASNVASQCTSAAHEGVDLLLAPAAPSLPWLSDHTALQDPLSVYAQDVLTIPASLAHLPAITVPVVHTQYPEPLLRATIDTCELLAGLRVKGGPGQGRRQGQGQGQGLSDVVERVRGMVQLPVGLQLIGRLCDEHTVLAVASVLEQMADFRAPAYVTVDRSL
jgi:aspartyl-tRNA(Asn)/glutamyl-tRNA(Gln) amidotransferase subunit A